VGAKEPARALYGASAYAARRTPSPGRLRASPAAVATHHHLTPARPSCLGWERPSDGRVRQTRVVSAFSGRFHTSAVVREREAYAARAGVRPRLGRRRGAGAAARPREPPPPLVHIVTGARSRAAGAYLGPTCAGLSVSRLERLVIVRLLNYCRDNAYIVKLVVTFQLA
jgi:hypothetical protein